MSLGDSMSDKVIDLLKTRDFIVPFNLFNNYKKLGMSDFEFIFLVYLINEKDKPFNPILIAKFFSIELHAVLEIISNLQSKDIIQIDSKLENNVRTEFINLDNVYRKLSLLLMDSEVEVETKTIFTFFESEYGRVLSPTEIRLINNWKETGYKDEMIKEAVKEAVFNGVTSFKYIDKILFNWSQNGVTTGAQMSQKQNSRPQKELFEYDWLNEK